MTPRQEEYYKEIMLYNSRMGKWPTIGGLADITNRRPCTVTAAIKRMVRDGYVEYVGNWVNGQSRRVKIIE